LRDQAVASEYRLALALISRLNVLYCSSNTDT
jgi:hypothetical protein